MTLDFCIEGDLWSIYFGQDTYDVMVYPNVDYAFFIALIVILHEINAGTNAKHDLQIIARL
ncbi:hypothetical protein V2J09_011394 [Rumex salicifolius]